MIPFLLLFNMKNWVISIIIYKPFLSHFSLPRDMKGLFVWPELKEEPKKGEETLSFDVCFVGKRKRGTRKRSKLALMWPVVFRFFFRSIWGWGALWAHGSRQWNNFSPSLSLSLSLSLLLLRLLLYSLFQTVQTQTQKLFHINSSLLPSSFSSYIQTPTTAPIRTVELNQIQVLWIQCWIFCLTRINLTTNQDHWDINNLIGQVGKYQVGGFPFNRTFLNLKTTFQFPSLVKHQLDWI